MLKTKEKRKIAAFINICAVVFFAIAGCSEPSGENKGKNGTAAPEKNQEGVIVALGDSLTEGYNLDAESSYPALLEKKLRENGYNYRVINAGVSGETSAGTLARVPWIMSLKPDIVILETGANDGLRGLDPELTKENIREIIRRLKEENVHIILAGMKMFQSLGRGYSESFNSIYPELAESENVDFIPFFLEGVAGKPELNMSDGIHPNEKGYRIIADLIYPHVVKAIS